MSLAAKLQQKRKFFKPKYLVLVVVFLGLLVFFMSWGPKSNSVVLKFLPTNTSFYWHWSNPAMFDGRILDKLPIIKAEVPTKQQVFLSDFLGDANVQMQEIVWFRVHKSEEDYFLLRLNNTKTIAKNLSDRHPDYHYQLINKDLLLLSKAKFDFGDDYLVVPEINLDQGINIFWQNTNPPDFLQDLSKWLQLQPDNPIVFANLKTLKSGQTSFNVWQNKLRQIINATSSPTWPNQVAVPYNADVVLGFTSPLKAEERSLLAQYVLKTLVPDLPYYNLGESELDNYIFQNNYLLKNQSGWLLIGQQDWQAQATALLPSFSLVEKKKVLSDGTAYIEYQASEALPSLKHNYRGKNYWQIGNLYGLQLGSAYYLSDQASLIEKTIVSQTKLETLANACGQNSSSQINDLLLLQTDNLVDSQIKELLKQRGISSLTAFSYENNNTEGWQACF